jgi:poly-gamma-glutamate capsule biosynthesis protein CapA/YwtB (metallophosphatase superfamily)
MRTLPVVAVALALAVGCTVGEASTPPPTSAPPSAAPVSASAAPAAAPAETITIAAVGDVLMGTAPNRLPPGHGTGFFAQVAKPLRADLTMGNLETPLSEPTGHVKCQQPAAAPAAPAPPRREGCFAFRLPPTFAAVLRDGGFHVLSLANNHTNDAGPAGLRNTRAALASVGLVPTGGPDEIAVHEVRGIRVAVLGFGPYSWMASVLDIEVAAALVRRAQDRADLVVVHMHAGGEGADRQHVRPGTEHFLGENRGDPMVFARTVVDAGADLVVGHGPHVLRGMEFHRGRLIAYSLGNFAGYRTLSTAFPMGVGGILRATLAKDGTWVTGTLVPTHMVGPGLPAPDPTAALSPSSATSPPPTYRQPPRSAKTADSCRELRHR